MGSRDPWISNAVVGIDGKRKTGALPAAIARAKGAWGRHAEVSASGPRSFTRNIWDNAADARCAEAPVGPRRAEHRLRESSGICAGCTVFDLPLAGAMRSL